MRKQCIPGLPSAIEGLGTRLVKGEREECEGEGGEREEGVWEREEGGNGREGGERRGGMEREGRGKSVDVCGVCSGVGTGIPELDRKSLHWAYYY